MTFTCRFTDDVKLLNAGAPRWIAGTAFTANKAFSSFQIGEKVVQRSTQVNYLDDVLDVDSGWTAFVCGNSNQIRLFAYSLMHHYAKTTDAIMWHFVNGSRYDKYRDAREIPRKPHMMVIDSLLTHPEMHPNATRGYDPARIGKIFDLININAGYTSSIVLCPDIDPETAHRMTTIRPEYMFYLKRQVEEQEH